ncbi:MAG: MerR family transcriptional regulator [Clostridia bacterium]|nr:MerR family transcriptional regulator [Clostridia bacterium]MBQ8368639.1 MerR family transcriptional regulator [Clostridia bacterium]
MTIKEASQRSGLSQDTLRFYEKSGMIPPVSRNNGIRDYSEIDLRWISLARSLRNAGLSVESTAKYLRLHMASDEKLPERLELLIETRQNLLMQRKQIDEAVTRLEQLIVSCRSAMELQSGSFPDSFTDHVRPEAIRQEYPGNSLSDESDNS